ncbi:unnamed protein product [Rotaria sp. Silwood1]|nr:unnamed protein product [Rotaria sp. Silwood1]
MACEFEQILMNDAYLRLIKNENESDNDAFHRIINFQARSIGKATLQKIEISTKDDDSTNTQDGIFDITDKTQRVQLMTIHNANGLEFHCVFIASHGRV